MKSLALVLTFIASANAFAYSHPSKGTGVLCAIVLNVNSANPGRCRPHVAKETRTDTGITNINHKHVYQIEREVDNPSCFLGYTFQKVTMTADLMTQKTGPQTIEKPLINLSANAYQQASGMDMIEDDQSVTYIEYSIEPSALQKEEARLEAITGQLASSLKISYDDSKKELTTALVVNGRPLTETVSADYAKGVRVHGQSISIPTSQTPNSTARVYPLSLICTAL